MTKSDKKWGIFPTVYFVIKNQEKRLQPGCISKSCSTCNLVTKCSYCILSIYDFSYFRESKSLLIVSLRPILEMRTLWAICLWPFCVKFWPWFPIQISWTQQTSQRMLKTVHELFWEDAREAVLDHTVIPLALRSFEGMKLFYFDS